MLAAILPIALTIAAGFALKASGIIPRESWGPIETLCYRLLFPVLLIDIISNADLAFGALADYAVAILVTLAAGGALALAASARMDGPARTTIFQTATRWNGFLALAAAPGFLGAEGAPLIAMAMVVIIAPVNIACVLVLSRWGSADPSLAGMAKSIGRNPLVQGSLIGLAMNLAGLHLPGILQTTFEMIGAGGLGIALLCVGAGIEAGRLRRLTGATLLGLAFRPVLMPALFLAAAWALGLGELERLAGVLAFAVPTAANGYIVARAMGGDAPLYAEIMAWQTLLAIAALPLWAALA
ncbi:AEC family transporter [Pseudoroseicyclus sp. CXY001]|uniref:AEC family transporter n=1 Tax=Pseudoroseicyclus sp. CXY001 TaxID=3242492 RepID=UPI003570A026